MRLLDLPHWFRSYGLEVYTVRGWEQRGKPFPARPQVVVGHHTATSMSAKGDIPTLSVLRDGRSDLPGPLCQVGLSRSGVVWVIASGKANHAGRGRWGSVSDSASTVGIEAEHDGKAGWSPRQLDAFDRCVAALLDGLGLTADAYCGHREWALPAGRKPDPTCDLDAQRRRVHRLLAAQDTPVPEEFTVMDKDTRAYFDAAFRRLEGGPRTPDRTDTNPQAISLADLLTAIERVEKRLTALEGK